MSYPSTDMATAYAYNATGAVTQIKAGHPLDLGHPNVVADYAYDNLGRRISVSRGNGVTTAYDYDAAGRLEELAQNLASTANDVSFAFSYNAAGQAIDSARTTANSAYVWPQPTNNTQNWKGDTHLSGAASRSRAATA